MAIDHVIDHRQRVVFARAHGQLDGADLFRYQAEVWSLPEVRGFDELVDMNDVLAVAYQDDAEVRRLAELAARKDPPENASRMVIVAGSDYAFGLGQKYQAFRESVPGSNRIVQVFRTRAEAIAWLGVQDPS